MIKRVSRYKRGSIESSRTYSASAGVGAETLQGLGSNSLKLI
jgi:hypothetical protein